MSGCGASRTSHARRTGRTGALSRLMLNWVPGARGPRIPSNAERSALRRWHSSFGTPRRASHAATSPPCGGEVKVLLWRIMDIARASRQANGALRRLLLRPQTDRGCGQQLRPFKRRASGRVQFNERSRITLNGQCGHLRFIARPVRLSAARIFCRTFKPVVCNRSILRQSQTSTPRLPMCHIKNYVQY